MHPTSDLAVMPQSEDNEEKNTGSGGNMEKMNTAQREPNDQNDNLMNDLEKNTCDQADIGPDKIFGIEGKKFSTIPGQVDQRPFDSLLLQSHDHKPSMEKNPSPKRCSIEGIDTSNGKKAAVIDYALHATGEPIIECKGSVAQGTNLASSSGSHLQKHESTAENDLRTSNVEATCAETEGVLVNEIKNKSQDNEMMLPCDKIGPVLYSPCHSRIHMTTNKGKEKSLSDGDAKVRLSKGENDSNSSVESCNSAGSFRTGKKRRNFPQQLIIGSKRVKNQIQETSCSKSYVKHDSSFMNWISNMVKGLTQSIKNDSNTLVPTLANPDHNLDPDDKLIARNMNEGPEPKNTGFKSIFRSIYCPNLKNTGTGLSHQEGEGCEDTEPANVIHGIDATPITCCAENNNSQYKQHLLSNKFEVSTVRYDAGPSSLPKTKPLNFFSSHERSENHKAENKNCSSKDKEEMASHSSSTRQNTNNTENVDSADALSERREAGYICHQSDTLGSLWITRFYSKSTSPLSLSDNLNERIGSQVPTTDYSKHISYLSNCKTEQTREQSTDEKGTSTGLNKGNNDHKSNPMASTFARRLGAIKHIIPKTSRTDSNTQVNTLCLFCGTRGHQLSDCSGVLESELKDLQKNISLLGGLEELPSVPCICIKCLQPNHWAISCHASTSTRKHEGEVNTLVSDYPPSGERISPCNEGIAGLQTSEDGRILSGGCNNDETDQKTERNLKLKRKSNEVITSKVGCNASFKKYCSSSSDENKFKENPLTSPSILAERHISHVPKGIFDAVQKLRLSRTDILKWINTHGSISQLGGFFLRLRLGKCEEGLGGSGYHVASINEAERQSSEQSTKKSLSVNVGGVKCMLESQYISNHDFLEDEIMEWWSTTAEAGVEIPSEEDLIKKIEKKRMLGL
ncbi:hypothetical protein RIF29_37605 [Crotalaria pallida]|uniref:Plus3 domain-containing protein n=1 Tax=Crotalaria pallida TaxID=3830 RepID=A0AAN9EEK0_CROPI